jgi:hypothetical protein
MNQHVEQDYLFSKLMPDSIRRSLYSSSRWFRPSIGESMVVSGEIKDMSEMEYLYLSTKQVPSALLVSNPGSRSVTKNLDLLHSAGFPLEERKGDGPWIPLARSSEPWNEGPLSASQVKGLSTLLSSMVEENARLGSDLLGTDERFDTSFDDQVEEGSLGSSDSEFEAENPVWEEKGKKFRFTHRIAYTDPFKVNAAYTYALESGKTPPKVLVWGGDKIRLSDVIPKGLLGPKWTGNRGKEFHGIANLDVKLHVIREHTHWGKLLGVFVNDLDCDEHQFGVRLWRRVKAFLDGRNDPLISSVRQGGLGHEDGERPLSKPKSRANRFLQVLVTIDGVFVQKYLAFPGVAWTWEKYDRFVLGMLHMLLPEEFLDGDITTEELITVKSAYAVLKTTRQDFKEAALRGGVLDFLAVLRGSKDPVGRIFANDYEMFSMETSEYKTTQILGILSQTRAAGTPPPLVVMRSKKKFLDTVTQAPPPLGAAERAWIEVTLESLLRAAPDEAFTGLQTKIGIKVPTSACYERTRAEGGTADAINEMVVEGGYGRPAYELDLETGVVRREFLLHDGTPGEYIFWRCLEEVLAMDPEVLRKVYLLIVREPGKARGVTKGWAALKVVLDLVNGWVSWPLAKAYPSSSSGMLKESHAWNFFKDMMSDEEICFNVEKVREEQMAVGVVKKTITYRKLYSGSTDFETATDYLLHEVAEIFGDGWMRKCGVPSILRGVVVGTCYRPRTVEFQATGCLASYGDPVEGQTTLRRIRLVRGVLMGDPLTKVVLHLVNMTVRELSLILLNRGRELPAMSDLRSLISARASGA